MPLSNWYTLCLAKFSNQTADAFVESSGCSKAKYQGQRWTDGALGQGSVSTHQRVSETYETENAVSACLCVNHT